MRKKTLKRGRKTKEDKLQEALKILQEQNQALHEENRLQASRFRERIESMLTQIRKLNSEKAAQSVVIITLGRQIADFQEAQSNNDRAGNFQAISENIF